MKKFFQRGGNFPSEQSPEPPEAGKNRAQPAIQGVLHAAEAQSLSQQDPQTDVPAADSEAHLQKAVYRSKQEGRIRKGGMLRAQRAKESIQQPQTQTPQTADAEAADPDRRNGHPSTRRNQLPLSRRSR
ncbi:MAG: hypothetical protein EGQ26_03190 [Clostridiales bacterium]|nr:hypothetical protein [Clostridiales bacterium]